MLNEFKKFILKGNMMDMAVGIIIGGAFTVVVNSLVSDVMMPPIGKAMGGVDLADLKINLGGTAPKLDNAGQPILVDGKEVMVPVEIRYGKFLNTIVTLLIVGFCVFLMVRGFNKAKEALEGEEEEKPKEPSAEEKLLTEIRDLLAKN
ncbi:MAG: large-conductance mechanosensitive channel protein MscL [Verrucomicrobiota bacterium]